MAKKEKDMILEDTDKKQQSAGSEVLSLLFNLGIVIFLTIMIVTFVGQRILVSGSSMEDTLHDGDNLIVDKISYRFREPQRYDIIVFPYKYAEDTHYIKRIIGLPGETVYIEDSVIYIDGEVLQESYGTEEMVSSGIADREIQLADDEYFVLGDNRNSSADSRDPSVGNIKRSDIIGRAWVRIWPLNSMEVLKHE